MTIEQLFEQGARKIRLPEWNEFAYLEITDIQGELAPWGKLWDIGCAGRDVLLLEAQDSRYEAWTESARLQGMTRDYIQSVYGRHAPRRQE